ncbi:hypothetical protein LCGC14_0940620 [marine sediment metagenome]|uniref:Uncharacterized protein n=1 Tax=marine sediment metagenome TaxID=412755 RepID=A0A0F9RRH1_9ZZZZ
MLWPRKKYSLRNCNPPEKMKRKWINDMDFKDVVPIWNWGKNKWVDLSLLRRFLYRNKISCEHLYSGQEMENSLKRVRRDPSIKPASIKQKQVNRFDFLDI